MPNEGKYSEKLPCGGTLEVRPDSLEIQYYFPGPDLRHNGTFVTVHGVKIGDYIRAFQDNFVEFERLKRTIPEGGEFTTAGEFGMTIRIGGYNEGVCLQSYHLPISNRGQLEGVVQSYSYAEKRANQVMPMLRALS